MNNLVLGISIITLLGYGVTAISMTRIIGLLSTNLIQGKPIHHHLAIFGVTLLTSVLQSYDSIFEVIIASCVIAIVGLQFPTLRWVLVLETSLFLIMNSFMHA
jgi:hypothetical protein